MASAISSIKSQVIAALKAVGVATKADLKNFATKEDLQNTESRLKKEVYVNRKGIHVNRKEIQINRTEIKKTQKALEEVEITIAKGSEDHEQRIARLETFHPQN